MQTANLLDAEEEFVKDIGLPLVEYRNSQGYQPVFGEGPTDAQIMLIGEAPGKQEAVSGRPFVGDAGKVLSALLTLANIQRDEVYITSVVKDRPPENRTPTTKEILAYKPYLIKQILSIKPKLVLTLGRVALLTLAEFIPKPRHATIQLNEIHGEVVELAIDVFRTDLIPLFHPAAVFYNPSLTPRLTKAFQNIGHYIASEFTS